VIERLHGEKWPDPLEICEKFTYIGRREGSERFPTPENREQERFSYCFPRGDTAFFLWVTNIGGSMPKKNDVPQGTLALMVLKTLQVLGAQHGYGIARRIEQISGDLLAVNHGTLYPVLLRLEQEGAIASEWGASDNNRRARFYKLTRAGHRALQEETLGWQQTAEIVGRFLNARAEDLR